MINRLQKGILLGTVIHLVSCSEIQVQQGPFNIESDQCLIEGKIRYLDNIRESSPGDSLPNVLLILVDDLGKYDISAYDPGGVDTPAIDELASKGVRFNRAYASCSVCSPSRASLMTGRYQQRFGYERQPMNRYPRGRMEYWFVDRFIRTDPMQLVNPMSSPGKEEIAKQGIPHSEILLSEILTKRGYRTGIFGKWHLGQQEKFLPTNKGFDEQYGFYEAFTLYAPVDDPDIVNYRHDYYANRHIWRQRRKEGCAIRENGQVIEEDTYLTNAIADRACRFIEQNRDSPFFLYVPFSAPHTPFQVPLEYYEKFRHIEDDNKRIYYGMIAALDDAVNCIMEKLEDLGLTRQTLVFFASDNGGAAYTGATENGILKGGKFSQFEGGINIPMIISYRGCLPEGADYDHPVSLMDIYITAAAAAGCELATDRPFDGINLIPYLTGLVREPPRRHLFWKTDFNRAILSGNWKFVWNIRDHQEFLYNLEDDPGELHDLSADQPGVVTEMKERILQWVSEMKDPLWPGVMEFRLETDGEIVLWAI